MGPIRGQTRPLPVTAEIAPEARHIDAKLNASIHNRFDIEVINAETGEVRQRAQAENVICNNLWSTGPDTRWMYCIWYGSGTGTPSSADTKLFNGIEALEATEVGYDYDIVNRVYKKQRKIQLSETRSVGRTITEVGCSNNLSSGYLCTHAMLKDMNGNEISITKTATDIINIYATSFVHWAADIEEKLYFPSAFLDVFSGYSTHELPNKSYGLSYSPVESTSENWLSTRISGSVSLQYNASNKTYTFTCSRIPAAADNYCGLKFMGLLPNDIDYYISAPVDISSDIVGESIGTGDGTSKDYATYFPFCSNVKVYLNSAQTTDITVDVGFPFVIGTYRKTVLIKTIEISGATVKGTTAWSSGYGTANLNGIYPANTIGYNYYQQLYPTKVGIAYFSRSSGGISEISMSDDLATWVNVTAYSSGNNIPLAYQSYKYIRVKSSASSYQFYPVAARTSDNNIHFNTAPPSGAVITADYHTDCIAKDVNHVFDFSLAIQFGEHAT